MTYFDLETASILFSSSSISPIDALGMSFGVPECLLDLGKSAAFSLLPSGVILDISKSTQAGRQKATDVIADLKRKYLLENGLFEIDTENGTFIFKSDNFNALLEDNKLQDADNLGGLGEAVGFALQAGSELYENYKGASKAINGVIGCIESYENFLYCFRRYCDCQCQPSPS
jgi:hypothetical protein